MYTSITIYVRSLKAKLADISKRYKEHNLSLWNNNTSIRIRTTLTRRWHTFGPMESIMEILSFCKKRIHSNTTERYCIYNKATISNQLKDKCTSCSDKLFKLSPILEDTDTTYPSNAYTFSRFLIPSLPTILLYPRPLITSLPVTLFDYPSDDNI